MSSRKADRQRACLIDGCTRDASTGSSAKGLCSHHYGKLNRYGDPLFSEYSYAKKGSGTINNRGYRVMFVNNKSVLEHRLVVERLLGRTLLTTENVHHRNGQKLENTVGPCVLSSKCQCTDGPHNLELWSKCQPCGKRVEDLVAFAHEILRLYGGGPQ